MTRQQRIAIALTRNTLRNRLIDRVNLDASPIRHPIRHPIRIALLPLITGRRR